MKKLLILGASNAEVDVVKIAQSLGYYVIVTDYYTDSNIIPAKFIANESWNISWTDYDMLESKCRESGVDGVLAGFSEFRVESMIEICKRLNLPSYLTYHQLEVSRNKDLFKKLCKEFGVPIVNEYAPDSNNIVYPVIIKPTDRGGSIGINVAYNESEYHKYLEYAYSMSPSKTVIVEDYIGDGVKFDCSYYVNEQEVYLIETCDTIMLSSQKGYETLQKAWTFSSKFEQEFVQDIDEKVKSMLKSLEIKCGVVNISFFYRNGSFYVFETGFRLGGGHSFDYQRASGGIDYLTAMIKFALNEEYTINTSLPSSRGYAVTYNVYFKPELDEIVESVIGELDLLALNEVITYLPFLYKGVKIESNKPMKIAMCTLYSKNLSSIIDAVSFINRNLKVVTNRSEHGVYCELKSEDITENLK